MEGDVYREYVCESTCEVRGRLDVTAEPRTGGMSVNATRSLGTSCDREGVTRM